MVLTDRKIIAFAIGIIFVLAGFTIIFKPDFFTTQLPAWFGFVVILFGGFVVLFAKGTTVNLNKTTNKLSFVRKGLLGKSIKEHNLNQVKEIELSAVYTPSLRRSGGYSYRLAFIFNNGQTIPLNPGSSSVVRIGGRQITFEKTIGARIAGFLNVPFQERRPPTARETLSAISSAVQSSMEKETKKQGKV